MHLTLYCSRPTYENKEKINLINLSNFDFFLKLLGRNFTIKHKLIFKEKSCEYVLLVL